VALGLLPLLLLKLLVHWLLVLLGSRLLRHVLCIWVLSKLLLLVVLKLLLPIHWHLLLLVGTWLPLVVAFSGWLCSRKSVWLVVAVIETSIWLGCTSSILVAGVRTLADSQQSLHEVAHCMQPAVDVPSCCTDPVLARIAVVDIAVGSLHMDIAVGIASVRTAEGRTAADELAASSAAAAAAAAAAVDSLVDFWMPR